MKKMLGLYGILLCIVCGSLKGNTSNYAAFFKDKKILITGGTGTLGSSLVKKLLTYEPRTIIIFSRDEAKHFKFLEELGKPACVKSVLGDIKDYQALCNATKDVDIVIHAAALKRVDMIEVNVEESIKTNVLGSLNVYHACMHNKVKNLVFVSTDKSCSPISAYGAGKFLAEKLFTNYVRTQSSTICCSVRFGNIIGSTGSIMPIFLEKIKKGEDIPLTDAQMTRFMITKEEAVYVIFDALLNGVGGEVFVKQVPSIRIIDLIELLIVATKSKSKIITIGIRPGERTYETLVNDVEVNRTYEFNGNYIITPHNNEWISSFNGVMPDYIKQGSPLRAKIAKELSSHDYIISKQELELMFDSFVTYDENSIAFRREFIDV